MLTHIHRPEWHTIKLRLGHFVHDSRFWAVAALVILFGLVILTVFLVKSNAGAARFPTLPLYPYMP